MVNADIAQRFLRAQLLDHFDPEARRALVAVLEESHAHKGDILLQQGGTDNFLSFLMEGTAVIERTFNGGHKEELAHLTGPAVFGTISFFLATSPSVTVRATSDVCVLNLGHAAHDALRTQNPRAAEALALAIVRVLAERFELLDKRLTDSLAQHAGDGPRMTEWSGFRARLFEESGI